MKNEEEQRQEREGLTSRQKTKERRLNNEVVGDDDRLHLPQFAVSAWI
jgi:hypothetical protein